MQRLHEDDLAGKLSERGWLAPSRSARDCSKMTRRYRSVPAAVSPRRKARFSIRNANPLRSSRRSSARWARLPSRPNTCSGRFRSKAISSSAIGSNGTRLPRHRSRGAQIVQSWDVASTTAKTSDWSVCTTWLMIKRNYYLLDVWRGRLEFPHLRRKLIALAGEL